MSGVETGDVDRIDRTNRINRMGGIDEDRQALRALSRALKGRLFERDAVVDGAMAALVAGHHLLLVGPPGTAKSLLARLLCEGLEGATLFEWLLTRFSTPDELFGPLDLAALSAGRTERRTEGYLPRAHIVFLDEVFKANSAILNALLSLMNERIWHDGGRALTAPLTSLIAASNELPDGDDALSALYDRFLVRFSVGPIESDWRFIALLRGGQDATPMPTVSLDALARLRKAATAIPIADGVIEAMARLRRALDARGIPVSDRRWTQILAYLRASTLLSGGDAVPMDALRLAEPCLWLDPEDLPQVREALSEVLDGSEAEAKRLRIQAEQVAAFARQDFDDPRDEARAAIEAHVKLGRLLGDAERLVRLAQAQGASAGTAEETARTIATLRDAMLDGE